MYKKIKEKIYRVINEDEKNDFWGNLFDSLIVSLTIVSILLVILDTFEMPFWYREIAKIAEVVCTVVFSAEYLLRLITSDLKYDNKGAILSRLKYVFSFMAVIDLLAILPSYLPLVFGSNLVVLRALRLLRLIRVFKFSRYTKAMKIIGEVFHRKFHQLISSMVVIFVLMIIASVLIYNVENQAQPEVFKNAFSGLWWAVATFTTVGYGDIYPITTLGKFFAACIALLGIGIVAVPTGIISAGFIELADESECDKDKKKFCPYCGHEYED